MDKNLKNPLVRFNGVPKIIVVTSIILHDIDTWFDNYVSISRFPTIFLKWEKKKERTFSKPPFGVCTQYFPNILEHLLRYSGTRSSENEIKQARRHRKVEKETATEGWKKKKGKEQKKPVCSDSSRGFPARVLRRLRKGALAVVHHIGTEKLVRRNLFRRSENNKLQAVIDLC